MIFAAVDAFETASGIVDVALLLDHGGLLYVLLSSGGGAPPDEGKQQQERYDDA